MQSNYKKINFGNNTTNKSTSQVVDSILNIKSYNAKIDVKVKSNKNENTYSIKQEKTGEKKYKQEVLKPSNIEGTIINYENGILEIKNTNLNLNKIFENYPYLEQNSLLLSCFIDDYKSDNEANMQEDESFIYLSTNSKTNNKYNMKKILIIDKKTGKPTKLEIKDITKSTLVYILYNEIDFV